MGWNGICVGHMPDSCGVLLPLVRLQFEQAATHLETQGALGQDMVGQQLEDVGDQREFAARQVHARVR